jgi:tetratricopeptide (TPR) repeat protein
MRGDEANEPARLSDYPAAQASELALLHVRREPDPGSWRWSRTSPARTSEQISLAREGSRLQCDMPAYTLRTDGDTSAIAWRGLRLVELGVYPEVLRRVVDAKVPWLPHRSNEELARLFEISEAKPGETKNTGDDITSNAVWLRLVPAGLARDGDTYLQIAYSREHGRTAAWESYVSGKLAARIRFSGPSDNGSRGEWQIAEQQDTQGHQLARWELVKASSESPAIPPVADGWKGYVHLDRRADQPAVDAPFAESLKSMRDFDWAKAAEQLGSLTEDRARHPLVQLLQAWCLENNPTLGPHDRLVAHLMDVARSDAPDLLRLVADGHFTSLTRDERYAILSLQPEATRTAADCDRLADAAIVVGKQQDALRYVEEAIARAREDGRKSERQRRCVELLLRLEQTQDALVKANEWSTGDRMPHELASMAELLAQYSQSQQAETLFRRALESKTLADEDRYRLLCRWAGSRKGVARCEKLLEAAKLKPIGSRERLECVGLIRQEMATAAQAEAAGQLAAKTDDAELSGELLLLRSELTHDNALAADLVWQLHESGQLKTTRLAWACQVWNRVHQPQRVIAACERVLRSGLSLSMEATPELAAAYREEGRDLDAKRAAAQDALPKIEGQVETGPRRFGGGGLF